MTAFDLTEVPKLSLTEAYPDSKSTNLRTRYFLTMFLQVKNR